MKIQLLCIIFASSLMYYGFSSDIFSDDSPGWHELRAGHYKQAFEFFTSPENKDKPLSKYYLGVMYRKGLYVSRDKNQAFNYFLQAAHLGLPVAQYNVSIVYLNEKNDAENFLYWTKKAAEQNFIPALHNLAVCYFQGFALEKNEKQGIVLLERAAALNDSQAMNKLGVCFLGGFFVKQNIAEGIAYLKKSISQNNTDAMFLLGSFLYCFPQFERNAGQIKGIDLLKDAAKNKNSMAWIFLSTISKSQENNTLSEKINNYLQGNQIMSTKEIKQWENNFSQLIKKQYINSDKNITFKINFFFQKMGIKESIEAIK